MRAKDTGNFSQRPRLVLDPVEYRTEAYGIKALIGERLELLGDGYLEAQAGRPGTRESDAFGEWIDADYKRATLFRNPLREPSGSAASVEDAFTWLDAKALNEPLSSFELRIAESVVGASQFRIVMGVRSHVGPSKRGDAVRINVKLLLNMVIALGGN